MSKKNKSTLYNECPIGSKPISKILAWSVNPLKFSPQALEVVDSFKSKIKLMIMSETVWAGYLGNDWIKQSWSRKATIC
jgi:hypothetical protein